MTHEKDRYKLLQKEKEWVVARQALVSQFEIKQASVGSSDPSEIDLAGDSSRGKNDVNKVEVDHLGLINAYKYLPLPTQEEFRRQMKVLNIKSFDDVILYS